MDFLKKLVTYSMLAVGLGCCLLGFAIGIVETYHIFTGSHNFEYPPFIGAGVFILSGASLIQTQSVRVALANLIDVIPLLRSVKPGGSRKTDPPIAEESEDK